jgi:hypothetical protein
MSAATLSHRPAAFSARSAVAWVKDDPAYQAFLLHRIEFGLLPILFGLDKFFDVFVSWESYLAPWINDIVPGSVTGRCTRVGAVERAAMTHRAGASLPRHACIPPEGARLLKLTGACRLLQGA